MKPVMSMIVPGRRSLGETWSKVNVVPKDDGTYDVQREDTEAPADGKPIFVPGLGNISLEMADFILEWERKEAEYRARDPQRKQKQQDNKQKVNEMFHAYVEQRLKGFKGQSLIGPGGMTQRERIDYGKRTDR